jgi:hypothetical protein
MSGGHFEYAQYKVQMIADQIEALILYNSSNEKNEYGDVKGRRFTSATITEFTVAMKLLQQAYVYAQRIDWLVSGDDGEDSFHKRLKSDLYKLKEKNT